MSKEKIGKRRKTQSLNDEDMWGEKNTMWREDIVMRGRGSNVKFSCKHTALPSGTFCVCVS